MRAKDNEVLCKHHFKGPTNDMIILRYDMIKPYNTLYTHLEERQIVNLVLQNQRRGVVYWHT
jgi:hypothetical protein